MQRADGEEEEDGGGEIGTQEAGVSRITLLHKTIVTSRIVQIFHPTWINRPLFAESHHTQNGRIQD